MSHTIYSKMIAALLLGSTLLVTTPASATTITTSQTIDLATVGNLSSFTAPLPDLVSLPLTLFGNTNISFELTVDFKDNQALKITSGSLFSGLDTNSSTSGSITNVTISFTDFLTNGTLAGPVLNFAQKNPSPSNSFGPTFNIFDLGLGNSPSFIQFGGFTLTYDIFILPVGVFSDTTRLATTGTAELTTNQGNVSAVPLPAALPLYGTGLALMGFLGWRRRQKAKI